MIMTPLGESLSRTLRVLIVDDHILYAEALSVLLGQEQKLDVVGISADGRQAVADAAELEPDIVLMDIEMPLMDGISATRAITKTMPATKVVVMTALTGEDYAERAIGAGATACIRKFSPAGDLLGAIEAAA
ncbi:MAG TPA: response regulator transcription factor [Gaiellaceae bacterium]|jgi:DNA-binding NarL/FixJ family response regulator